MVPLGNGRTLGEWSTRKKLGYWTIYQNPELCRSSWLPRQDRPCQVPKDYGVTPQNHFRGLLQAFCYIHGNMINIILIFKIQVMDKCLNEIYLKGNLGFAYLMFSLRAWLAPARLCPWRSHQLWFLPVTVSLNPLLYSVLAALRWLAGLQLISKCSCWAGMVLQDWVPSLTACVLEPMSSRITSVLNLLNHCSSCDYSRSYCALNLRKY